MERTLPLTAPEHPRLYGVSRADKAPLLRFVVEALEQCRCRILFVGPADRAPFRVTFETPAGERIGIVVYAFFANRAVTRNRPGDEHRFQVKYGPKDGKMHPLWIDPHGLYTTLFCGIDPERGLFVAADPALHNPTRFFISVEYKDAHVASIRRDGWSAWERARRATSDEPVEILVGGTKASFLRYVLFERAALGESQGHRGLLAERTPPAPVDFPAGGLPGTAPAGSLHSLVREFALTEDELLDLIGRARRLKMAVRGWVAEEHLVRLLRTVDGVGNCARSDEEGAGDVALDFAGVPLRVECKNVLRHRDAAGLPRVDFQRTRAAKSDPCSRFYSVNDFDVLAACLNAVEETAWGFSFIQTSRLAPHRICPGKLASNVRVNSAWSSAAAEVLSLAAKAKS